VPERPFFYRVFYRAERISPRPPGTRHHEPGRRPRAEALAGPPGEHHDERVARPLRIDWWSSGCPRVGWATQRRSRRMPRALQSLRCMASLQT